MNKKVIVVTPTIGSKHLLQCHQSIADQTHKNTEHLVVVDGKEYESKVKKQLKKSNYTLCTLPYNTGKNGFYGHRVYSAFPHIINCDYVIFLDEDNWFEPEHVENAINIIDSLELDWCFSLRNLVEQDGSFIVQDNCESIGPWSSAGLVDTSAYCFKLPFIRRYCFIWDYGWGADRRFFSYLSKLKEKQTFATTGKYTLNYRLGGNESSVQKQFIIKGNAHAAQKYNGDYPWIKKCNS